MTVLWSLVLFLHVTAAAFWVGGQLMLSFVVMPALRRDSPPETIRAIAQSAGRRFTAVTNHVLLPALLITGPLLAWHDGARWSNLVTTAFGHLLIVKVALVVVVFTMASFHGFVARRTSRRGVRIYAIITVIASVGVLALAAFLAMAPGP
ncbi:MAG: hypothetical protein KGJ92_03450 [Actinomycetales bacterium]|nr:hypothetical protein [Actinomycetales bacterium]